MINSEQPLKDVQNSNDDRGVNIQKVGINNLDVPLKILRKDGTSVTVSAKARLSADLPDKYKGTHMSRFIQVLSLYGKKNFSQNDIKCLLEDIKKVLKAKSAHVKFDFKYFIDKKSPVTHLGFPMGYDCSYSGNLSGDGFEFFVKVNVPVTTLCPCSKEISQNGAHNQRAVISVKVKCLENEVIMPEDLIETAEECGSCPVYPLLKRSDEKFVTEKSYLNPKFVEDVLRDLVLKLRNNEKITGFEVQAEAYESIHNHNAWAYQAESLPRTERR